MGDYDTIYENHIDFLPQEIAFTPEGTKSL